MTLEALSTPSKSGKKLNHHTIAIMLKSFRKAKRRPRKKPFLNTLYKRKHQEYCQAKKAIERDNKRVY
jgi:hypothetical protein